MREREELAPPPPDAPGKAAQRGSDAHRIFLLECRLEQMRATVDEARAEAHRARELVAEASTREADHARRHLEAQEEVAAARQELASMHRRLEHSEALRAGLEGRLFESTRPEDAQELVRLRREVAAHGNLTEARKRTVADLRARVSDLAASRETLLSRVAEWQRAAREGDPDAVDLAELIAVLSRDILELEHRSVAAEKREVELREQLLKAEARSVVAPTPAPSVAEASPTPEDLPASPAVQATDEATPLGTGEQAETRGDTLLRLGRSGDADAYYAIRSSLVAPDPSVRATAYQALAQLFEDDPARLEPHLRGGIADTDPRVRRRVVLAAAGARGLDIRSLLEPLRRDPDPHVRRVVLEVLRRAPSAADGGAEADGEQVRSGAAS